MDGSIVVFGGTGFIGDHLVPLLFRRGATVRYPGRVQVTTEAAQAAEYIAAARPFARRRDRGACPLTACDCPF
jgi:uncharacterized protein YbjT (DUF2867 family)